jgi:serine phosphatase RsbU (regulator of sigma subunit)
MAKLTGSDRKIFKIRWQLMIVILPIAIIPLIIIVTFVTNSMFSHLERQSKLYYSTILGQVGVNMDFVYNQYARTITNMSTTPDFIDALNTSPYKNALEEDLHGKIIIGDETIEGAIRNTVEEKIDGVVFIYELDRASLQTGTSYKVHSVSENNIPPTVPLLTTDQLFLTLKRDNRIKMIMGKLQSGTIPGYQGDDKPVIIFPLYSNPPGSSDHTFEKFILITLFPDFISRFYKGIDSLKYGTLYVLDRNSNILDRNHPREEDDYYEYDSDAGKYILGDDDPDDKFEEMSYKEYLLLNTDDTILGHETVQQLLYPDSSEIQDQQEAVTVINYSGVQYMVITGSAPDAGARFVYFHPLQQVRKPIYDLIKVLIILTFIIVNLVILISLILSKGLTNPIHQLYMASRRIAEGDYSISIDVMNNNEIGILAEGFKHMITEVRKYTGDLEKMVDDRTHKLKEAHIKLKEAHSALWGEMELTKKIQKQLLPVKTSLKGYDIAAHMIPAEEVGGDIYEIVRGVKKNWIAIGDVSGHGVTPGLLMMMVHTAFTSLLEQNPGIKPVELFEMLNSIFISNTSRLNVDKYMTMSILMEKSHGHFIGCGKHNDILIYRAKTGTIECMETRGVWLGLKKSIQSFIEEYEIQLFTGDVMMLSTDGLNESSSSDGTMFESLLPGLLLEYARRPSKVILEKILDSFRETIDHQVDDVTLIIVKCVSESRT